MQQYEYKFVPIKPTLNKFQYERKLAQLEQQWQELGKNGWKFCTSIDDIAIFIREKE